MGLLSFGAKKSKTDQQSSGSSFGLDVSQQAGGSFGQQFGQSFVDQSQAPFLDFLRNQAQGGFGGFQQGQQQFGQQLGGLGQQSGQIGQQALNNPFLQQLQQQAGGNQELVAAQTAQLGSSLGDFFNEQLLPGISRGATGAGQLGGGRQGVAQAGAAGQVADAFSSGVVGFQQADAQRALQAGQAGGQQFQQGIGQALGGLGQQAGFAGSSFASQFQPLAQLSSLFGDPTVLQQSGGFDSAFNFGSSFGFDVAQNQATSKSRSGGFNLGFG